jgi:hypothetical protein
MDTTKRKLIAGVIVGLLISTATVLLVSVFVGGENKVTNGFYPTGEAMRSQSSTFNVKVPYSNISSLGSNPSNVGYVLAVVLVSLALSFAVYIAAKRKETDILSR